MSPLDLYPNLDDLPPLPGIPSKFDKENPDMTMYARSYAATYGAMVREAMKDRLLADAMRWRWWEKQARVARDQPDDWTCWIDMPQICYRSKTTSVNELTDSLMARFPNTEGG
jgi:hypothetical protein